MVVTSILRIKTKFKAKINTTAKLATDYKGQSRRFFFKQILKGTHFRKGLFTFKPKIVNKQSNSCTYHKKNRKKSLKMSDSEEEWWEKDIESFTVDKKQEPELEKPENAQENKEISPIDKERLYNMMKNRKNCVSFITKNHF